MVREAGWRGREMVREAGEGGRGWRAGSSWLLRPGTAAPYRPCPAGPRAIAVRAGPALERRDHHQVSSPTLTLHHATTLRFAQRGQDPLPPAFMLQGGVRSLREPQEPAAAGARHVDGPARHEPLALHPGAQQPHRARQLGEVRLGDPFQILDALLVALLDVRPGKPFGARENVHHAHVRTCSDAVSASPATHPSSGDRSTCALLAPSRSRPGPMVTQTRTCALGPAPGPALSGPRREPQECAREWRSCQLFGGVRTSPERGANLARLRLGNRTMEDLPGSGGGST